MISCSLAFALYGHEVDIVGKFLAVQCFLVVLHDVGEVGVPTNLGQNALFLGLLQVVLGSVVFVFREDLFLH